MYILCTSNVLFHNIFSQHFVSSFFFIFRENDYRKCCLISVCWPPRSHLHAQEVPARSHVPSSRADQACSPLHLIPNRLSGCTVGGEDDQVHLHSLPRHGNIFTRYISLWNIQLGMNQKPLVLAYEMFVSIFIIAPYAFKCWRVFYTLKKTRQKRFAWVYYICICIRIVHFLIFYFS